MTPIVKTDPEILGGKPCFNGTRVPIDILFDYIKRGRTVDYFLEQFPSVTRQQVNALLDDAEARTTPERVPA